MKKKVRIYKEGGDPQQAQQEQGGGQMEQLVQMVQQMASQGAQPAQVAAELLGQQVPPEAIMQVFVQMGMPQEEAQGSIQEAMQGGQQQAQAPGEEMMEGQGQPSPEEMAMMQQQQQGPTEEQLQMAFGGPAPLNESSESYIQDRLSNFTNAVKKNTFMATAKQDIFGGDETKMKYGGDLPKADLGNDVSKTVYDENKTYKPDGKGGWIEFKPEPASTNQRVNPNVFYIQQPQTYNPRPLSRMFNTKMRQPDSWNVSGVPEGFDPSSFLNGQPGGTTEDGRQWGVQNYESLKGGLFGRKNVGAKFNIAWGDQLTNPSAQQPSEANQNFESNNQNLSLTQKVGNQLTRVPGLRSAGASMYSGRNAPEDTYVSPVKNQELVNRRESNTADANFGNVVPGLEGRDSFSFNQASVPQSSNQNKPATKPTDLITKRFLSAIDNIRLNNIGNSDTSEEDRVRKQFGEYYLNATGTEWNPELESEFKNRSSSKKYGGGITNEALRQAAQTIMMAYGGDLPKAKFGDDLKFNLPAITDNDDFAPPENEILTEEEKLLKYQQGYNERTALTDPNFSGEAVSFDPIGGNAEVEARFQKGRINPQWANAAADLGLQTMNGISNFASQMQAYDPERERAVKSSSNARIGELENQGYDQFGNFMGGTDIGGQNLNPTGSSFNRNTPIYSYGGSTYNLDEAGELTPEEIAILREQGLNL